MIPEIETARAVLEATRHLQFDEHPSVDLRDRLGLLTVVAGLREVAAFGFAERANEDSLKALKDALGKNGLATQMTRQVRLPPDHRSLDIAPELAQVFDQDNAERYQQNPGRLLWVCRNPKTRERIKRAVEGEIPTGTLLGYPKCCVEQDRKDKALFGEAYCKAILSAVANDPDALQRALRGDLEVPLELDAPLAGDMEATDERFPFVQHIACQACLSSDDSSARLNLKYEQLARETSADFHAAIGETAKVTASIGRMVDEVESKGLNKETIDSETNQRLQSLFREQERIAADFLGGRRSRT